MLQKTTRIVIELLRISFGRIPFETVDFRCSDMLGVESHGLIFAWGGGLKGRGAEGAAGPKKGQGAEGRPKGRAAESLRHMVQNRIIVNYFA